MTASPVHAPGKAGQAAPERRAPQGVVHGADTHRGRGGQLIEPQAEGTGGAEGEILCRRRLGGILSFYHREAA